MSMIAAILGRLLLAALFIIAGANKLLFTAGATTTFAAANLPAAWVRPVGIFELVAGVLLGLGLMTRLVSVLLAIYTAATILFLYNDFGDYTVGTMALLNVAVIGGLLVVFAYGQMRGSYDYIRNQRRHEVDGRDTDQRVHDAELRAARAEGRADARPAAPDRPVRPAD